MAEEKSGSFIWLLLIFFVCPLLCCGILSSNSNLLQSGQVPPTAEANAEHFAQVLLPSYLNNKGIGSVPGQANFDGSGFSYPVDQLPASGLRFLDGVPYLFPKSAPNVNDNIAAMGQVIKLPPGNFQQAFLLVATSWGTTNDPLKVTVQYTDGSTSSGSFSSPDWATGPPGAVNVNSRYSSTGTEGPAHIYAVQIAMDGTKTPSSLTLPMTALPKTNVPCVHVFALSLQYAA